MEARPKRRPIFTRCPKCGQPVARIRDRKSFRSYLVEPEAAAVMRVMPSMDLFYSAGGIRLRGDAVGESTPGPKRWGFRLHEQVCSARLAANSQTSADSTRDSVYD